MQWCGTLIFDPTVPQCLTIVVLFDRLSPLVPGVIYRGHFRGTQILCSHTVAQWWGKIYLILNILNKYRIIIICRMGYLFIYIIPKWHEIVFKYIPIQSVSIRTDHEQRPAAAPLEWLEGILRVLCVLSTPPLLKVIAATGEGLSYVRCSPRVYKMLRENDQESGEGLGDGEVQAVRQHMLSNIIKYY